jgi:hypothetical protein
MPDKAKSKEALDEKELSALLSQSYLPASATFINDLPVSWQVNIVTAVVDYCAEAANKLASLYGDYPSGPNVAVDIVDIGRVVEKRRQHRKDAGATGAATGKRHLQVIAAAMTDNVTQPNSQLSELSRGDANVLIATVRLQTTQSAHPAVPYKRIVVSQRATCAPYRPTSVPSRH